MERHPYRNAALAALVAWPLAAMAQAPLAACIPGTAASPGTMTEMGFPCPEGAGPGAPATNRPTTAETGGAVGPGRNRVPAGAAGVSGSARMNSIAGAPDNARPSSPETRTESGAAGETGDRR